MTKRELNKKINEVNDRLYDEKRSIVEKFDLLMDYLGLEIIIEKSIEEVIGINWFGRPIPTGEDRIKYTKKIVKKTNKTNKK